MIHALGILGNTRLPIKHIINQTVTVQIHGKDVRIAPRVTVDAVLIHARQGFRPGVDGMGEFGVEKLGLLGLRP